MKNVCAFLYAFAGTTAFYRKRKKQLPTVLQQDVLQAHKAALTENGQFWDYLYYQEKLVTNLKPFEWVIQTWLQGPVQTAGD